MEEHERPHYLHLTKLLRELDPWLDRIRPEVPHPRPGPGSALHGDDRRTHPYETSDVASHSLSHAVDHLHMLRSVLVDARVIHMYSPFSLLRAALENASAAVWLLAPAPRPDRLMRRLRFAAADIRSGERVKEIIGNVGPRTMAERLDDLRGIAQRERIDPEMAVRRVGYEEIVRTAGAHTAGGEVFPVVVWKACSAIAHGDMWPTLTLGLTRYVELPGAPEGRAHLRIEANVQTLLIMTQLTMETTHVGWRLLDERSRSPHL